MPGAAAFPADDINAVEIFGRTALNQEYACERKRGPAVLEEAGSTTNLFRSYVLATRHAASGA
jgi:hypothetical protein